MIDSGDRYVSATSLSEGWLEAVRAVDPLPGRKAVHLVVRIAEPERELGHIRAAAEELVSTSRQPLPSIDTTRNTIFPAAWAERYPEPAELAGYYRSKYARLRKIKRNGRGTYFGRIVAHPRSDADPLDDYGDQLTETVRKLRVELAYPGGKSSRYEINIYNERSDRNPMSFPCMSFISLHLHRDALHMQATYRNEYLVMRGYGNYLGLAQLQDYLARACNVGRNPNLPPIRCGELLITAGHAELDHVTKPRLKRLYERAAQGCAP